MLLEYEDIRRFLPAIKKEIKEELENSQEKFISYPRGMQKFLFDEVSPATYQRVYTLWNKRGFPRVNKDGLKGVWLTELKQWQRR